MYNSRNQRDFARSLRNNSTPAEKHLWRALRCEQLKGIKFRRQAAIGDYVVDFVSFAHWLIIELDGGQHNETAVKEYDARRTAWLAAQGFRVLRFWNHDVMENLDGVIEVIWRALQEFDAVAGSPPSPTLPAEGRECR